MVLADKVSVTRSTDHVCKAIVLNEVWNVEHTRYHNVTNLIVAYRTAHVREHIMLPTINSFGKLWKRKHEREPSLHVDKKLTSLPNNCLCIFKHTNEENKVNLRQQIQITP